MISAEDTLYLAERTLNTFVGWKDGFTCGARLKEEPPVLVEAVSLIGDYIQLLQRDIKND